jgi:hypothetical protein
MADDEHALKERFVREWLLCNDPFKAALSVIPNDTGKALRISTEWPQDEYVLELRSEIIASEGSDAFLPSKDELAREIYLDAKTMRVPEDRLKGFRLYAEIRGFISKPGGNSTTVNNFTDNRSVMVVKDHGSNDDWERKLAANQKKLIAGSQPN